MKVMQKLLFAALLLFGATTLSLVATDQTAVAQDDQENQAEEQMDEAYSYVAQPGDSYSVLARKAIQTYGIQEEVSLSEAQIVAAETNLTIDAGSPILLKGEKVEIDRSLVADWVEKAEDLSNKEQKLWQPYTVGVDFNTDKNGEA